MRLARRLFAPALGATLVITSLGAGLGVGSSAPVAAAQVGVANEQYRFCMVTDPPGALPTPSDLGRLFDQEPAGVVGADYQRATALPDGRVLWTFQDAAVRTSGGPIVTVHNIAVLQQGACFSVLYRGSRANPRSYLFADQTDPFHRWYWPLDASLGSDGRLYVYVAEMVERSQETPHVYLEHVEPLSTQVAVFDPATNAIVEYATPPNASAALYGWSVTDDADWTYLYGHCYRQFGYDPYAFPPVNAFDRACAGKVTVARVPRGELWAPYQYWDGASWQGSAGRAAALTGLAAQRVNASQFRFAGNRFWVVDKEGDWWGDTIYLYVSERPTGPFRQIAAVPQPLKCPASDCNTFFADWVPAEAVSVPSGRLVWGLSHNRWSGEPSAQYRPTFHTIAAPAYPLRAGDTLRVRVPPALPGESPPAAAALNVTATAPRGAGHLTVYACDRPLPTASNLNYPPGPGAVANLVLTALDGNGDACIYSHAGVDVVVDVAGTFTSGEPAAFTPETAPVRLVDTRSGVGGAARLQPETELVVPVGSAAAVALNVTAAGPQAAGYLTAYPCDQPRPVASNVNYAPGQTVAVLAVARPDAAGNVCLFSKAATDVVVDLAGRFVGEPGDAIGGLLPLTSPTRLADTRAGDAPLRLAGGTALGVSVPGASPGSTAVLSVAAIGPEAPGYVTVFPCDQPLPTASNLNYLGWATVANLAFVPVAADGSVCLFTKATADVIVDLAATMPATAATYRPVANPRRLIDTRLAGLDRG